MFYYIVTCYPEFRLLYHLKSVSIQELVDTLYLSKSDNQTLAAHFLVHILSNSKFI